MVPFPITSSDTYLDCKATISFKVKCIKMATDTSSNFFSPSGNPTILIFVYEILWQNADWDSFSIYSAYKWLAVWLSGNALASINIVVLRQTRLVLGWVTVCG